MVTSLVTCTIHIFAVCVAVRTVIERGDHHQTHDAVDNEFFIGALVVHLAPRVVCSREQSVVAGCRRFVGFVSELFKRRRTSGASPLLSFRTSLVCPIAATDIVSGFGHVAEMVFPMRSVFHTISSLEVRGSCVVCCTVSVCTVARNND